MGVLQTQCSRAPLPIRRWCAVREGRRRLRRMQAELARLRLVLRQSEEELGTTRRAAHEAERARHRFLANMSHELRTPLHSIIGFSAWLLAADPAVPPSDVRDLMRRIHASGSNLLRLVDMLLDFSKIEAGWVPLDASCVDVLALARAAAAETKGLIDGRPLEIVVEGEEGLEPIETDAGKLKLILVNLLGNAVKYTPSGRIAVRVGRAPSSRRPRWIDVADSGPGVRPDLLPGVQEVLAGGGGVTHRNGRTCLGLGIAAALARQIGGRISLPSGSEPGAVFRVELPRGVPNAANPTSPHGLPLTRVRVHHDPNY